MMHIPNNQPISFTVYKQAIANACIFPNAFLQEHAARIEQAFDHGEPVQMIIDELKMRYRIRPVRSTKTPRQIAKRVVRVS